MTFVISTEIKTGISKISQYWIFGRDARKAFSPYAIDIGHVRSFVRHADQLVWRGIRFFCTDIQQNRYWFTDTRFSPISPMTAVCCGWRRSRCIRSHNTKKQERTPTAGLPALPFVVDRLGFCIKSNVVSKVSSNLSSEQHRQRCQIERRSVSPSLALRWVLVIWHTNIMPYLCELRTSHFCVAIELYIQ